MTAGSQAVFPGTARNLLLSLGGVIQEPDTNFTISGSTLTFTTAPVANTTFFAVIFGDMQSTGTPSDGTVLPASIASSGNFSFPQLTVTGTSSLGDDVTFTGANYNATWDKSADSLIFNDQAAIKLGTGGDFTMLHTGTGTFLSQTAGSGHLYIRQYGTSDSIFFNGANSETFAKFTHNGSCELYFDNSKKLETTSSGATVTGTLISDGLKLNDNEYLTLGTGNDFLIGHAETSSFLRNDTGELYIRSDGIRIVNQGNDETYIRCIDDGAVELYHDNSKKLSTSSSGIQVEGSGILNGSGTNTTTLTLKNATDTTGTKLGHSSNSDRGFLQVTESGADFGIQVGGANTANMRLELFGDSTTASRICFGTEEMITAAPNGAVKLYYDNSNKFETRSNGVEVLGHLHLGDSNEIRLGNVGSNGDLRLVHDGSNSRIRNLTGQLQLRSDTIALENNDGSNYAAITGLRLLDGAIARFGSSNDLQISHDGSNSLIADVGTGALVIKSNQIDFIDSTSTEFLARFFENSAIELYFDSNKKFETTSAGTLNTGVSKFITGNGSTASDDNVVHVVAGSTADRGIMIGTGRASGAAQNDGMGYIDAINSESNGYGSQLQFRIDGTAVMTIGYNSNDYVGIGTTLPNKLLHVDTQSSTFNHFIAEFTGVNSTNAASLNFYYMGCGSQDNRTGLYWEHQNVANIRMWMDDNSNLRQSSSDPTAHNSGTAFSYAGGSDYRLKENVVNYTNGITELKQLKAYKFNYIDTDRTIVDKPDVLCSGFYAHEAGEVVPASLIGEKDEVDFEGNPVYQSLKYEKFVPLLTAALQEAVAKIETLEAKVAALEAA